MLMNVSVDEREEAPLRRIIGYMGSIIKTADSGGGWGVGGVAAEDTRPQQQSYSGENQRLAQPPSPETQSGSTPSQRL